MSVHRAFLIDYNAFREEIEPYVDAADQGNFEHLAHRAIEAADQIPSNWHFFELGDGALPKREDLLGRTQASPRDIGFWMRIIMSEYMTACASPGANWSIVYDALQAINWSPSDCDLIFQGMPVYKLLKPDTEDVVDWPLTEMSPYWLWLHPGWAKSGWLPTNEISRIQVELTKVEGAISTFDVNQLPDITAGNPSIIEEYSKRLALGFANTTAMISSSVLEDKGLLMSITIYA